MRTSLVSALLLLATGCEGHVSTSAPAPDSAVGAQAVRAPSNGLAEAPDTYLDLHRTLYRTDSPDWSGAVRQLKTSGNLFTLHVIEEIQRKKLPGDKTELLKDLSAVLRATHVAESLDAYEALRLLEVAAYADVTCHAVEYPLRDWTLVHVARFASVPGVRAELGESNPPTDPHFGAIYLIFPLPCGFVFGSMLATC